ncbi:MAG TPA: succinylglutamate desuccinylase/aspartoacylase family protein [Acidimicrobiia bacterium]
MRLWVHVVNGSFPGPTLALLSTLHGGEWFSIPPLRDLISMLEPDRLSGTVLCVPVANPPALGLTTRNMPDESDSPDLNRAFPGTHSWTSDQLAAVMVAEVLQRADALLDFHVGPWGSAFRDILVGADFSSQVTERAMQLALAFGSPIVRKANVVSGFPGPRSAIGYAGGVLGIPALGVEVGGAGFGPALESKWRSETVDGVLAVMGELGMLEHRQSIRPRRQLVYSVSRRVNPSVGGILRSEVGGESLGTEVDAGTVLGTVTSPYTLETLEELVAPVDGLLFYMARDYPVNPGDWAFGIADVTAGDVQWVESGDEQ